MADELSIRPVRSLDEAKAAGQLFDHVWQERRVMGSALLWAMARHGGQVIGAFRGDEMVGAQVGLVGLIEGSPTLHSHITGVLPGAQHHGVGYQLKLAQREWCLERGIDRVTWTFDPMVSRNAYFNLVKLGAVAERFHRNHYGEMEDGFNRGDRSDRLEVVWELGSDQVREALGEIPRSGEQFDLVAPAVVMEDESGQPLKSEVPRDERFISIAVPADYHALRAREPGTAQAWRDAVADALETVLEHGYRIFSFSKPPFTGYLLEKQ